MKAETIQPVSQSIQEGQDSTLTVSGTGTEQVERETEETQAIEVIGRGERI
jgi:hypothetical protein